MNKSVNRGFLTAAATFLLGVVGTIWYFKSQDCKECKRRKDDELFSDNVELCDQSAFDGSQRVDNIIENNLEEVNKDEMYVGEEKQKEDEEEYVINEEMRTSQEWYRNDDKVNIKDVDGWRDNENPEKFWKETPITKEDYIIRRNLSTLSFNSKGDKYDPFLDNELL